MVGSNGETKKSFDRGLFVHEPHLKQAPPQLGENLKGRSNGLEFCNTRFGEGQEVVDKPLEQILRGRA